MTLVQSAARDEALCQDRDVCVTDTCVTDALYHLLHYYVYRYIHITILTERIETHVCNGCNLSFTSLLCIS
jgi:hypothetical protein